MVGMLLYCVLVTGLQFSLSVDSDSQSRKKLALISFDGFRWDYINKYDTPHFDALAREGVHAQVGIRPVFATKTFANHYSIVTGLYEESHGIVNNRMYDPEFQADFKPGNNETRWWDGGQPIWITARLQKLRSAVYFWPGSETRIDGVFANYFKYYNKSVPFRDRMDQLVTWLSEDDVDMAAAYFHEPDGTGHKYGPDSEQIGNMVKTMDELLGYLLNRLKETGLAKTTNLIVLSDHGMAYVSRDEEHVIKLSDYLDMGTDVERVPQSGAVAMILPKEGMKETVYRKLVDAKRPMTVYKKEDIPERYHYKNHRRIMPIVLVANEGYYIIPDDTYDWNRIGPGEHGYDNLLQSMQPIFYARGPDFKSNAIVAKPIENINFYSLMCHLLDIQPSPNNGSWEVFRDVLRNSGISLAAGLTPTIGLLILLLCTFTRNI